MAAIDKFIFEMNAVGNAVPEMKKVEQQLSKVNNQVSKSSVALKQYANTNRAVTKTTGNFTRNLGMASLQFQDIAVQASMGTNALRIMTMQGPQLASVFGPKGMIIGALVATGGAILGVSMSGKKLTADFKKIASDFPILTNAFKVAFDGIKRFASAAFDFMIDLVNGAINGIRKLVAGLAAIPDVVAAMRRTASLQFDNFRKAIDIMINGLKIGFNQAVAFVQQIFMDALNIINGKINSVFDGLEGLYNKVANLIGASPITIPIELPTDLSADTSEASKRIADLTANSRALADAMSANNAAIQASSTGYDVLKGAMQGVKDVDIREYFKLTGKAGEDAAAGVKKLTDAQKRVQDIATTMKSSMTDAFMSIADRTKTVEDAFRAMARDIIAQLFRVLVVQRMVNAAMGFLGFSKGPTGEFTEFANPFKRQYGGNVYANKPYLVGEAGPELMIPRSSGSIVPNNKLGGGTVVVNQTINISTGVQQTVRNEIRSLMPQIADSAKAAVSDAKRRGGSYGRAFA